MPEITLKTQYLRREIEFLSLAGLKGRPVVELLGTSSHIVLQRQDDARLVSRIPLLTGATGKFYGRVDLRALRNLLPYLPDLVVLTHETGYIKLHNPGTYYCFPYVVSKQEKIPPAAGGVQVRAGALRQILRQTVPFAAANDTTSKGLQIDGVVLTVNGKKLNGFAIDKYRCFKSQVVATEKGKLASCFVPRRYASAVAHISPQDDDIVRLCRTTSELVVECPPRIIVMQQLPFSQWQPKCLEAEWLTHAGTVSLNAEKLDKQLRMLCHKHVINSTFIASGSVCTMVASIVIETKQTIEEEQIAEIEFEAQVSEEVTFSLRANSMLELLRWSKGTITFYVGVPHNPKEPVVIANEASAKCVLTQLM